MKVDLPFLKQIAQATNERLNEAEQSYRKLDSDLFAVSIANWDDQKRRDYFAVVGEMKERVSRTIVELRQYLSYLNVKIAELENR